MAIGAAGCVERICTYPEIYRLTSEFFNLGGGHTNCYLITDGGEWLMIDSGAKSPTGRKRLAHGMREAGFDARNAVAFLTHGHFDHAELFSELLGFSTPLYLSRVAVLRHEPQESARLQRLFVRRSLAMGASLDDACAYAAVNAESALLDPKSLNMRYCAGGDAIDVGTLRFEVISTPGHTADHLALFESRTGLLISGDAVLEESSPSLDCQPGIEDGLGRYLESLEMLRGLPVSYALAGHGRVLEGPVAGSCPVIGMVRDASDCLTAPPSLSDAIDANVGKKHWKLNRVRSCMELSPYSSGQQMARMLLKCPDVAAWHARSPLTRYYALLEAFMMLQHLVAQGEAVRYADDYGIYRYALCGH